MNINKLLTHFSNYIPLNEEEVIELSKRVVERHIKRKEFILQKNDICNNYTFIVSGLFKMYTVDKNGTEHILHFASENDWICDINSFHNKKQSSLYIDAIEPSIIIQIDNSNLMYLFTHYHKFDRTFRVLIENKFMELENRILQNISAKAEERYQFFLEKYPNICNRIPNVLIASYLGITPEFLSKIRNTISKK
jgi:CRP-like cAMP-binding protein